MSTPENSIEVEYHIYYVEGVEFDSITDSHRPPKGVLIIVQEDESRGWITTSGTDYYVWKDSRWWGVNEKGLDDYCVAQGLIRFNDSSHQPVLIPVNDEWQPATIWQMFQHLMNSGLVLFGETVSHEEFMRVYRLAKQYKLQKREAG